MILEIIGGATFPCGISLASLARDKLSYEDLVAQAHRLGVSLASPEHGKDFLNEKINWRKRISFDDN